MIQNFKQFIEGDEDLPVEMHLDYGTFFKDLTYVCVPP
jgi:hypothetical protein